MSSQNEPDLTEPDLTESGPAKSGPSVIIRTVFAALVCVALIFFYARTQERTQDRKGYPSDGASYFAQSKLVEAERPIKNWAPFVYRMGAPYMVGRWYPVATKWMHENAPGVIPKLQAVGPIAAQTLEPDDMLAGYTWLGFLSGWMTVLLLYGIFRRYGLSRPIAMVLLAVYIANPNSPFRFSPFFPAFSDPFAFVFFFALYWIYKWRENLGPARTLLLCLVGFTGAFVREIVVVVPLAFLGAFFLRFLLTAKAERPRALGFVWYLLPVVVTSMGVYITRQIVEPLPVPRPYSLWGHAKMIWEVNLKQPEVILLCLFTSLGLFTTWVLAGLTTSPLRAFLRRNLELVVFLPGMLVLALIGGFHTDRFVFWALPMMLVLAGFLLQEGLALPKSVPLKVVFLGILLVAQILIYRAWLPIPDLEFKYFLRPGEAEHHVLAPYGENANYGQMVSAAMGRGPRLTLLTQFGVLTLILWGILGLDRWRNKA